MERVAAGMELPYVRMAGIRDIHLRPRDTKTFKEVTMRKHRHTIFGEHTHAAELGHTHTSAKEFVIVSDPNAFKSAPYILPDPRNNGETLPLVMVEWVDAMGDNSWRPFYEAVQDQPVPCFSVGFILVQDDKRLLLTPTGHMDICRVNDTLLIPAPWILKITPLGVAE